MLTVTATNLPRLMACNGSRLMSSVELDVERDDTVKREGDAAHWLAKEVHSGRFTVEELIDRRAPNGVYITLEMVEYLGDYLAFISQGGHVEIDTSFGTDRWQVNGRADHALYDENTRTLYIPDLKYGWGIYEPENNWTLIAHAIGWLTKYDTQFRVDRVVPMIFQPRPHHPNGRVRSVEISRAELDGFYYRLAETLRAPNDILHTGEQQCYKCPALTTCPAARKAGMNGVDASEAAFTDDLDNAALSFQLDHLARATKMLEQLHTAYSDLAEHRIKQGQIVAGYGLEIEQTNTVWIECATPELIQSLTGKDVSKKQIVTPNQAKKLGVHEDIVKAFTERRNKGVKLVRRDINAAAKKMFNPPKGN